VCVYAGTVRSISLFVSIFKHGWLMTGSCKNACGVLESPGVFCSQESGSRVVSGGRHCIEWGVDTPGGSTDVYDWCRRE